MGGANKGLSITEMLPYDRWNCSDPSIMEYCYKGQPPKPAIVALLLYKKRLAVIVSEDVTFSKDFSWTSYSSISMDKWPKIIMAPTPTNLSIRVYDISIVPLDGPLQLIAQSERPIQGSYRTAHSNDNTGVIVVTSGIDMHSTLLWKLYRSNPQYCGLNDTEYKKLAVETSLNHTERFIQRMLEELQLQLDGECNSIVPVSKQRQHN